MNFKLLMGLHVVVLVLGLASFALAVAAALMYLVQSWQLKTKHLGALFVKLPSLEALDRFHLVSLVWGVVLFSLGLLIGFFSTPDRTLRLEVLQEPRVVLSFLACLMYWVILVVRASKLRRGHKIAVGTLMVFILLFLTFVSAVPNTAGFHGGQQ